jgi:membrane protease YdiL (CAAX protease family)
VTPPPTRVPEGWYPDPYGQAPARYWDGTTWTAHLAFPEPERWAAGPPPTLRPGAAPMMIGAVVLLWVLLRTTVHPIADVIGAPAAVAYSYVALFGGMGIVAYFASRWFGTGDMKMDIGLRFHPLDPLMYVVGGLGLWVLEVVLGVLVRLGDVPLRSNGELLSHVRERPGLFAVYAVAAVIGAPIFEEICFRGVIQRSLSSWMPPPLAIGSTALLFGVYHFTPGFGSGNVGMILILAGAGAVLGTIAHVTGRLAPSMFAHAGLNSIVLALIWFVSKR